jgi:hypothetical protein
MPRIVITHAVRNVERWLAGKAEHAAASTPSPAGTPRGRTVSEQVEPDGRGEVKAGHSG